MIDDESAKKEGAEGRSSPLFLRGSRERKRLGSCLGWDFGVEVGPVLVGEEAGRRDRTASSEGKLVLFFPALEGKVSASMDLDFHLVSHT